MSKKGGITTTILNFNDKLSKLGENVLVFNNKINNNNYYKTFYSGANIKSIISQNFSFYIFTIELLFQILFFRKLKFKERIKLAIYYCFYPYDLVNRIKSIKSLVNYFKKLKVEIIFSISSSYPLIYSFILSKWFNKPLVTLAHGEDFIKRYPYNLNTLILQKIEKIILSNSIMKKFFLNIHNVKEQKLEIVFRGVNIENIAIMQTKEQLRDKYNIHLDEFIILTVSRIHYRKGIENVISALKDILDENPSLPIKYYIIGEGTEKKSLERLVKSLKLEKKIRFLGSLDDDIRNQYYKISDLFILVPMIKRNSIEGFGIVYIEANYFKLPVIGARSGGVKIAIEDGKTGYLVNPNDKKELKEKIMLIINDNNLRLKLGEYGHQRVKELFDWEKIAIVYRKVLQNTIKEFYLRL
ncbi:MAG: glycosyltransferase family 4 protein [Promethearchaeota archaeon]